MVDIKKAIELDSLSASGHKLLGDCYLYKNKLPDAIRKLSIALKLDNNYYQAYLARAKCYEQLQGTKSLKQTESDYKKP